MAQTTSPVSSLTRLLQKQKRDSSSLHISHDREEIEEDDELTNAVSIEGVQVPTYEEASSYQQRSPINISINTKAISAAPPIRAPTSASIHRQPSFYSNNSYTGTSALSTSIPFAVPNSGHGHNSSGENSFSGSVPKHSGLPSNISMIESTNITSPHITNHAEIEPRFVISKQKVAQVQLANSLSKQSLGNHSSSAFFSRSRKSSQMDLGSFYGNYSSPPSQNTISQSIDVLSNSPSSISSSESNFSKSKHSSMADLKRFFNNKKVASSSPKNFSSMSPITSSYSSTSNNPRDRSSSISSSYSNNISQYTTPQNLPFSKRYGKFGESLGAGAGGQVRLVKRLSDNQVFAVKEFRAKQSNETRREYAKKITSEYCIGSTLRHQNIVETIEIAYEFDRILQVLEYCDYDLFALVMSNKMSVNEVDCCFKQILSGVQYIHHMGLAHRDLKLDNCVVNKNGIVKIIDFGSAVVFSYPFSNTLIEASGIVGSDPYLSPETLVFGKYDPRPVDIWSAAMIYCCMVLKKFPWKVPKLSDNSFKLFCSGRESDSLSALLTMKPKYQPVMTEPVQTKQTSGLSNLSKAFNKPLQDIENESHEEPEVLSFNATTPKITKEDSNVTATLSNDTPATTSNEAETKNNQNEEKGENHTSNSIGEDRLLKALPQHVRPVIGKMVVLAPACRAQIDDIMADEWLQSVQMCHVEEEIDASGYSRNIFHKCDNHKHTQVDQSEAHIAALERKKRRGL